MPFDKISHDRKPLIGFSDITALQMILWRECAAPNVHGALTSEAVSRGLVQEAARGASGVAQRAAGRDAGGHRRNSGRFGLRNLEPDTENEPCRAIGPGDNGE